MAEAELRGLLATWRQARNYTEVFGAMPDESTEASLALQRVYRRLALQVHPDRYAQNDALRAIANSATIELNSWRARAESALRREAARRGQGRVGTHEICALGKTWIVERSLGSGDISDVELAFEQSSPDNAPVVFKVARNTANHDLLDHEARVLQQLWTASHDDLRTFGAYLPEYHGRFDLPDGRRANVLSYADGFVSLADVIEAYPQGVEVESLVWMWNRALELLSWVHRRGFVHGALLPPHVLIHPVTHGGKVIDWSYAVNRQDRLQPQRITALSKPYKRWYPPEVFEKKDATPALDLYLLAKTLIGVSGGDARRGEVPRGFPEPLAGLLRGCLLPRPEDRFTDAFELYERVRQESLRVYGPPRYHPFVMP